MPEVPADRVLDLVAAGAREGLATVRRIAWERAGPRYRHQPGLWSFAQVTVQITLRGLGRCWPTGGDDGIDLPPGRALVYDNRAHRRLVYGRASEEEPYEFLYINLLGEAARATIRDLAALHRHAVPIAVADAVIRDGMALLRAPYAHQTWPLARSAAFAMRTLLALTAAADEAPPVPADRLIAQAMSLLAAGDDDVGAIAGALGVSREHLARLFRERVGEPPARWRRRLRLERAERRVLAGEPIAAIARACGFATPAHFAAAFRARTGMTPTRFRASALRR